LAARRSLEGLNGVQRGEAAQHSSS
jgi:hypothetical protein